MATITHELVICDDCVQIIANSSTSAETGSETTDIAAAALAENWPDAHLAVSGDEDTRSDISSTRCGGCGTTDAGGRTDAVVLD